MVGKSETNDPQKKLTMQYLRLPLLVLNFFGLWKNGDNLYLAYNIYGFCVIFFTQYIYTGFQIIYMVLSFGNIQKLAEASYLLLTQVTLCFKIVMLIVKKRKIVAVVEFTDSEVFIPKKSIHRE